MRSFTRTLVDLLPYVTPFLLAPAAGCSSSSSTIGVIGDSGAFDSFVAPTDAGHDATHDAAKDVVAKDVGTHDVETPDVVTTDSSPVDAMDAVAPEAGPLDGGAEGGEGGKLDAEPDAHDAAPDAADASVALVDYYFEGRWDLTTPAAPVAEWAGSAVHATFNGTSIAFDVIETASSTPASLGGGGFDSLSVVIDGKPPVVVPLTAGFTTGGVCPLPSPQTCVPGENATQVATGLAAGQHTIAIYKTTDPFYGGKIQFKQFIPGGTGAALVKASYTFAHHIEWIGDDLSAGRGVGTEPNTCTEDNADTTAMNGASNESLSYAGLVSAHFKAERHNIAIGSSGVSASLGGTAPTIPSVYGYVLPDEPTNAWSFANWSPDAAEPELVVVNLGSYGDFTYCGTGTDCADVGATGAPAAMTTSSAYATAYITFLGTIRTSYPHAFILVVSGNGYAGDITPDAASDLANYVVNQRVAAGEKLTGTAPTIGFYTDYAAVDANDFTYTCGFYPNADAQSKLATGTGGTDLGVEGAIHTALGW